MKNPEFSFALITDTHIRPPQGDDSSPYAVNDLANDRARVACKMIADQGPVFTIHLGDMVHTLPHLPTYPDACEEAHRIFEPLKPNLHFVAGNHDIGDKPMAISPAGPVDTQSESIYQQHFGESCYAFEHGDCVFVGINSSLVNTGSEKDLAQQNWLENTLEVNRGKRIFICSHYPPFINSPNEPAHYDNYEEPGRSWFLGLLAMHDVEAVFSGHVHQFFYNVVGPTKFYCLPPTSFTRQDYAELYRVEPTDEFGRDDRGKFSLTIVDVDKAGHELRVIPTDGDTVSSSIPSTRKQRSENPLVFHLRHAWYEAIDLPFNGPMEEFGRKRARNDYCLLRLWQMGISRVRTPLSDLIDPVSRHRMEEFAAAGIQFTLSSIGGLSDESIDLLNRYNRMINSLELVVNDASQASIENAIASARSLDAIDTHLGKAHSSASEKMKGTKFAHNVSFGFLPEEIDELVGAMDECQNRDRISAVAFQLNFAEDLQITLTSLRRQLHDHGLKLVANARIAPTSPADSNFDDDAIARRVEQANTFAVQHPETQIQIDTFSDIDRGYSPRHGLLDRHYNFRPAGRWLAGC